MKFKAKNSSRFTFSKSERLHSKKLIEILFKEGNSLFVYPFKIFHLPNPEANTSHHQILVSVSAKKFCKAVERNLLKRRIREAYRLNKHLLTDNYSSSPKLIIGYIYVGKEILPYSSIEPKLKESLLRLNSEYLSN